MMRSADLAASLRLEIEAVEGFVNLLRSELALLQTGDCEPLTALAADKATLIARLGELATARNAQLAAAGHGIDGEGLANWTRTQGPVAAKLRDHLLSLAAEAKELNRLNGQLITMRLNHTQAALSALSAGNAGNTLYGRDGQASAPTGYRIIDSA